MEKLKGVIERITYHNEENGFSVIRLEAQGYYDLVTAVGAMAEPHTGAIFNFYGFWKVDPKYGRQFIFQKCEETLPATVNGIKKYLGSGLIKGVGGLSSKLCMILFLCYFRKTFHKLDIEVV